jgi:hypothetical protein
MYKSLLLHAETICIQNNMVQKSKEATKGGSNCLRLKLQGMVFLPLLILGLYHMVWATST